MTQDYTEHLNIKEFQDDLVSWFYKVQRDLPWRKNKDPYRILVSEIMLQQTQVVTVIPYYERFLDLFPTTKELAAADEQVLLKAWEGLGYYSRARNLQASAQIIEQEYGGVFPTTHSEILKLKGVGPYTAGAVSSIAFNIPAPAVDGNVFRVMSRVCTIFDDIAKQKTRKVFEAVVEKVISHEDPGAFNQGLMELGATVCTPKSPKCLECPVQKHCKAYQEGIDDLLPVKTKPGAPVKHRLVVGIIENQYGELLVQKRPETGLLANFYEFITFEYTGALEPHEFLLEKLSTDNLKILSCTPVGIFNHVFSHRIWEMDVYKVSVSTQHSELAAESDKTWLTKAMFQDYPLVTAHQKILSESESLTK
ncbi:MAG TPA: A/G-specific adenine glycosylase [Firmicutes bacterium]|nr:A/G-specific adenine glycosylase [Bacillota bacterium]